MLYFWKGYGTRTSKKMFMSIWCANTQMHKYTNIQIHKYSFGKKCKQTQHVLYFWKGNGTRTSKISFSFVWHANANTQTHRYTNTQIRKYTNISFWYFFWKGEGKGTRYYILRQNHQIRFIHQNHEIHQNHKIHQMHQNHQTHKNLVLKNTL